MMKYEIVKVWYNGLNTEIKVIADGYISKEEADIDRIYMQPDYDEILEVRGLNYSLDKC
jgi:hypothetical protein